MTGDSVVYWHLSYKIRDYLKIIRKLSAIRFEDGEGRPKHEPYTQTHGRDISSSDIL